MQTVMPRALPGTLTHILDLGVNSAALSTFYACARAWGARVAALGTPMRHPRMRRTCRCHEQTQGMHARGASVATLGTHKADMSMRRTHRCLECT